jgi:hypothetical protein
MTYVGNVVKSIAHARMKKGFSRKEFLREMALYWKMAKLELVKKEKDWLLKTLND